MTYSYVPGSEYTGVHNRLRDERGKASEHACQDCGGRAQEWAYNKGDKDEKVDLKGRVYSMNLEAYTPRCRKCHRLRDRPLIEVCYQGHKLMEENIYREKGKRRCRECARERGRRYDARQRLPR